MLACQDTAKSTELKPQRKWHAHVDLGFSSRDNKTVLVRAGHRGPLRVQRPFYPERTGCCHVYLLHPPGGLVIGDELRVGAELNSGSSALITTPSAGKIYGAAGASEQQIQRVEMSVDRGASLEWLPQETIIFNGANGLLESKFNLKESAKLIAWDIVRLGRIASGDEFKRGRIVQQMQVNRAGRPYFIERNVIDAGSRFHHAKWGLQGAHTFGTMLVTGIADRKFIDDLVLKLNASFCEDDAEKNYWGLSQKGDLFIARYLGRSIIHCRAGFEFLWQVLRPIVLNKKAISPRIWRT